MSVGLDIASGFPWPPDLVAKWAKEAGYSHLQLLPLRKIVDAKFKWCLPIKYLKNSRNDGNILAFINGLINRTPFSPQIHDVVMFPDKKEADEFFDTMRRRNSVKAIGHSINLINNMLLEVSPGLWLSPDEIIKKIGEREIIVLDLYHSRRNPRPDELAKKPQDIKENNSLLGDWKKSLPIFLPYTKLIHVSPSRDFDELTIFLESSNSELEEMIKFIKNYGWRGDYVVEATLKMKGLNPFLLISTLKKIREKIHQILAN